jgi:predicted component of viral defense system (DUF524 family)
MAEFAEVLFSNGCGSAVGILRLYPQTGSDAEISFISEVEARDSGEAQIQLLEGGRYEYELVFSTESDSHAGIGLFVEFGDPGRMLAPSKSPTRPHTGILSLGLNTGRLPLCLRADDDVVARASVEIRSRKLTYQDDYRKMLESITDHGIDLLMELRSPSQLKAVPDPSHSPQTLTQRFAFLRSLLGSRAFQDSLLRIISHPHKRWESDETVLNVSRGFRPDGRTIRQLAKASKRTLLPAGHPLQIAGIHSIPEKVAVLRNVQTLDTPENRFVKFALGAFVAFLGKMRSAVSERKDARLIAEISGLICRLDNALAAEVFRAASDPDMLPLGSPVLQRKEGYREVFQAWLRFDMAARLVWRGGDDVYGAGQRDVAALYEYWVFFRLLEIVCKAFDVKRPSSDQLIEETADGFGLKLKSGTQMDFSWIAPNGSRKLKIRYSYNRSFSHKIDGVVEGSWTERMRPDYTLSIWPAHFSPEQAEAQELMSHVHFDAKYRIENVQQLFGVSDEELTQAGQAMDAELEAEKREQKDGRYKRADLLKMHAYRDAIRRTHGAYVIYPGTESRRWEGFHEILPGLGAFPLRPEGGDTELEEFLQKIAAHACYRASARERHSYHTYQVYRAEEPAAPYLANLLHRVWPEEDGETRARPPAEVNVLVGFCKGTAHLNWIQNQKRYNVRTGSGAGSLRLSPEVSSAKYLLLHEAGSKACGLYRITGDGPRIFSKNDLLKQGYPTPPSQDFYLVFDIEAATGFESYQWNYAAIPSKPLGHQSGWPYTTTLDKILDTAVVSPLFANLAGSSRTE